MNRRATAFALAPLALLATPGLALAEGLGDLESPFRQALAQGDHATVLGLVFLAGLATSLTPCVYPMIAITVSVFGARQTKSRLEGAALSSVFVLGIAALFTPLGLFAATTGGLFGAALASPLVVGGIALLFTVMAASMFGAFEMTLPAALSNRLGQVGGSGYRGAFTLGLVSALIAAPCTGPVLGLLLTWVGTTGNVAFGALALFTYAMGLGVLFFVVGTFSVSLPRSGRWLLWVKSVFGLVMLGAAFYYAKNLVPALAHPVERTPLLLGGSLGLLVVGLALGAIHLAFDDASRARRARKASGVLLATAGLCGAILWLGGLSSGARIQWVDDVEHARAVAQETGLPMLVDFGASWCGACGELDRETFSDLRVVGESQRFVAVRVDLSPGEDTPEKRALLASYEHVGLPLVVLHGSDGAEAQRFAGFVDANGMLQAMQAVR